MNLTKKYKMISLSLLTSALLVGCGSSSTTPHEPNIGLQGSIIKGPIDGATITLKDADGKSLSTSTSSKGKFSFLELTLTSEYYTLESNNGSYEDEATKKMVSIPANQGLKTLLSKAELSQMISDKTMIAITPETTLYANTVKNLMKNKALALSEAMSSAKMLIHNALIKQSSPMPNLDGDVFLQKGDFTTAIPANVSESFARNRAVSFSYMVRNLGQTPDSVFNILDLLSADYADGKADGITLNRNDVNISESFALARTQLFQETTSKLQRGELTDAQKEELKLMGFDTGKFANSLSDAQNKLDAEVATYLASTTLPSLHILPTMTDEDGNMTDAKATYTLTANTDVNVTIQTPDGSWNTPMWRYNNNPLPLVIRTQRGNEMTLNFNNKLDANSTIHWHGFKIPADMDGGPDTPVKAGESKAYTFTMNQPAAPLWFHPHPDMQTGKQVYMGLAGVFLLEDNITKSLEKAHKLPSGDKDTVLLVQDRRFDATTTSSSAVRNLAYKTMAIDSDGMLGDTILVNGSVMPKQEVSNTLHRYRLYNVSNARNYTFALSDGSKFKIIGTDGGLLATPTEVTEIILGAAQRVEIIIDFSKYNQGDKVMLVSKPFNGDMMGMMGDMNSSNSMTNSNGMGNMNNGNNSNSMTNSNGMGNMNNGNNSNSMSASSTDGILANGTGLSIMRFDITSEETETNTLYTALPQGAEIYTRYTPADATNSVEREFVMSMGNMSGMNSMNNTTMGNTQSMNSMSFVINGKIFDPKRVDEFITAGATEIWNIKNISPMAHPFHAHAIQYQILSRNGVLASGVDLGWKDTFLVQPGETVKIMAKFEAINRGDYMYHCHILEHEDAGMMGYFRVGDTGQLGVK